jgi:hypothetical protein
MLGIFINNTNSDNKYYINLNNFNKLKDNFSKIIIFDNVSEFSDNLKKSIINETKIYKYLLNNISIDNNNDINIEKLFFVLKEVNSEYFNYITIINDNYIYCDKLTNYFKYVKEHKLDFYSYTDSSEEFYHYQLYLITFNISFINNVLDYLNNYKNSSNILIDLPLIFNTKISYLKVAYIESNIQKNIYYNDTLFEYYLKNNILNVLSINKLNNIINNSKNTIHIDIPDNFDINIYKNHEDLKDFDDDFLYQHFLQFGQFEIRNYSKNNYILPQYIRDNLSKCANILTIFDMPDDFNIYNYKKLNNDLKDMNRNEILLHWLKHGNKEDRKYNEK